MLRSFPYGDGLICDGQVPTALLDLLDSLGVPRAERTETTRLIMQAQLTAVRNAVRQRTLQVTHHWQHVGVPLENIGNMRYPELAACQAVSTVSVHTVNHASQPCR